MKNDVITSPVMTEKERYLPVNDNNRDYTFSSNEPYNIIKFTTLAALIGSSSVLGTIEESNTSVFSETATYTMNNTRISLQKARQIALSVNSEIEKLREEYYIKVFQEESIIGITSDDL